MLTHQDYRELADRAAQLARTCSEPNVSKALIALASNYTSMADRLDRKASKKTEENEQEKELPARLWRLAGRTEIELAGAAEDGGASQNLFKTCDIGHKQTSAATLRSMEIGEPTETTMATSTIFIPLPGFTWVSGGRSVEGQFCDAAEEFRACAAECQEIATHWSGEGRCQYEELARQWLVLARLTEQRRPSR